MIMCPCTETMIWCVCRRDIRSAWTADGLAALDAWLQLAARWFARVFPVRNYLEELTASGVGNSDRVRFGWRVEVSVFSGALDMIHYDRVERYRCFLQPQSKLILKRFCDSRL